MRGTILRKLWAAGAAIVVCLTLGGLPALAQEGEPTQRPEASPSSPPAPRIVGPFTIVSGTEEFGVGDFESSVDAAGVTKARHVPVTCLDVMNDPRVSGTATDDWNFDFFGVPPTAGLDWGTRRLVNDGGAWEGVILGAAFGGGHEELTFWLVGSGGYEGLSYYMQFDGTVPASMVYPVEGIIYEGALPMPPFETPVPASE